MSDGSHLEWEMFNAMVICFDPMYSELGLGFGFYFSIVDGTRATSSTAATNSRI